jgi:periplasmic divalent cation tolerance protein
MKAEECHKRTQKSTKTEKPKASLTSLCSLRSFVAILPFRTIPQHLRHHYESALAAQGVDWSGIAPAFRLSSNYRFMKATSEIKIVLTTTPNLVVAKHLAESAINDKLAACVSFVHGMESLYWWKGQIETTSEVLVLFKTHVSKLEALEQMISQHHPYETPEFVVLPVESASEKYLSWLVSSVAGADETHKESGS